MSKTLFSNTDLVAVRHCVICVIGVFSESTQVSLLDHMFKDEAKSESVLVNGVTLILTLLDFKRVQ